MPTQLNDDQKRRIYRDFLKGRQIASLAKKYSVGEGEIEEIISIYMRRKHPNDVGDAKDIKGPADLLVSNLDTGGNATENPIVARNPRDLRVAHETVVEEYDWSSPEEKLRIESGKALDETALNVRAVENAKLEAGKEAVKHNLEATEATIAELESVSKELTEEIHEGSKEKLHEQLEEPVARNASEARLEELAGEAARAAREEADRKAGEEYIKEAAPKIEEQAKADAEAVAEAQRKEVADRLEALKAPAQPEEPENA